MKHKDSRVDTYIAAAAPFARPILKHLRKIVHAGCLEIEETMKWSMPHFDYKGPVCGMAAFKAHCVFGFWKGELLFKNERAAGNDAMGHFGRITSVKDLPPEKTLIDYVRKAVALNEAGVKVARLRKPKDGALLKLPEDFAAALKKNKKASGIFEKFSPSKRKDYIEWITEAKRDETRKQRLATAVEWMAEGKARNWKYERK